MAALRAGFNLTPQEVSERLHIRPRYVNAIEEGRYELMPGKVYARGYVHTYAEFLGLNADEIVAQCFAGELPANAQPVPVPAYAAPSMMPRGQQLARKNWRAYGIVGAVALAALLLVSQLSGHESREPEAPPVSNVAPVPEAMLASVRNLVMPTPQNYDCLTGDAALSCLFADAVTHTIDRLENAAPLFATNIDVSSLMVVPAENAAPAESRDD